MTVVGIGQCQPSHEWLVTAHASVWQRCIHRCSATFELGRVYGGSRLEHRAKPFGVDLGTPGRAVRPRLSQLQQQSCQRIAVQDIGINKRGEVAHRRDSQAKFLVDSRQFVEGRTSLDALLFIEAHEVFESDSAPCAHLARGQLFLLDQAHHVGS